MAGGMGWGMLGSAEPQLGECFSLTACHAGGSGGFDGDAELGLSVPRGGEGRRLGTPFGRCGRAGSGVVKQELLGVAAVGAEVLAGEGGQCIW